LNPVDWLTFLHESMEIDRFPITRPSGIIGRSLTVNPTPAGPMATHSCSAARLNTWLKTPRKRPFIR
jgi:hypothetical protein